jgi:hypothetical protein
MYYHIITAMVISVRAYVIILAINFVVQMKKVYTNLV